MEEPTTPQTVAMYGGVLVVLGVLVIGLVEMALGAGHPVNPDGQIIHKTLVPIEARSYVILLGLLTWGGYGIYSFVTGPETA